MKKHVDPVLHLHRPTGSVEAESGSRRMRPPSKGPKHGSVIARIGPEADEGSPIDALPMVILYAHKGRGERNEILVVIERMSRTHLANADGSIVVANLEAGGHVTATGKFKKTPIPVDDLKSLVYVAISNELRNHVEWLIDYKYPMLFSDGTQYYGDYRYNETTALGKLTTVAPMRAFAFNFYQILATAA